MMQQPGIFALGSRAHHHLYFALNDDTNVLEAINSAFELVTGVAGVNAVIGLRPSLARQINADSVSSELGDFATMSANGVTIPADQHDMWIWIHGATPDTCFIATAAIVEDLAPHATLTGEETAFTYLGSRDLSGFEDGTENPPIHEAVGLLCSSETGLAPVALIQRWVHDLTEVKKLPPEQYDVLIGRTLADSEELDESQLDDRSHISRVVIEDDEGEELEMFRRSAPFGDQREHGLLFAGFAPDFERMHRMLNEMIGEDDGITDHVTGFSTCTGSGWYVVPPLEMLL